MLPTVGWDSPVLINVDTPSGQPTVDSSLFRFYFQVHVLTHRYTHIHVAKVLNVALKN